MTDMTLPTRTTFIQIHTDGACIDNPGPGGWAAIIQRFVDGKEEKRCAISGSETAETTNNKMEMLAAIKALGCIKRDEQSPIKIFSDSQYLVHGMSKWMPDWLKRGWKNSQGKAVANRDLWEEILRLCDGLNVSWHWVKGHAGNPLNEEVDSLANAAAEKAQGHRKAA